MHDEDGHFGEPVAAVYDEGAERDVRAGQGGPRGRLAGRAGRRRTGARARDRDGSDRAAAGRPRRPGARHRAVAGDGRAAPREAGRRGHRRHDRRLLHDAGRRDLPSCVPRLQHDHEPDHPGGAGRLLPQRRRAPRARRLLRHRGRGAGPPAAAARRDGSSSSTGARRTGVSTSTTSRTRGSISHHFGSCDGDGRALPGRSATSGRRSWT